MVQRQQIGATEFYGGRGITVRLMGPDFLCYVDKVELGGFFISPGAAVSAGQKYIDDERKAKERSK